MKLLSYPLSVIYSLCFGLTLAVFHPIQWICLKFGYLPHKVSVDWLQFFLMRCQNILGTRHSFYNSHVIPENHPLIIVANHQSMNDIPPLIWYFRKYHPKFISKKELGKGIPSVSFNLRHGGAALIDRNNSKQALEEITRFGKRIQERRHAAVIFPEGTRSRTGIPKPFKKNGLETLFQQIPDAVVVPVTINNSWKTTRYGKFPLGLGSHIKLQVHQPLLLNEHTSDALVQHLEKTITDAVIL